jgi:O-acetyl-ADP-ribose deacetylase (regulator of RNase III)
MIIYKKLDITTVQNGIVAHGVNCQFVMGAGVALSIKNKWPNVFSEYISYKQKCNTNDLLGKVLFVKISESLFVANCFTQQYYGNKPNVRYASPNAIRRCVERCVDECNDRGLDLYMTRIGCGLGGLNWNSDVLPIVEKINEKLSDKLIIYICDLK